MKTLMIKGFILLALIVGLHQKAQAQVSLNSGSTIATNTQSDYFAHYDFYVYFDVTYYASSGGPFYTTGVKHVSGDVNPLGSGGDSADFTGDIDIAAMDAAQDDSNLNGNGYVNYTNWNVTYVYTQQNYQYRVSATAPSSTNSSTPINSSWSPYIYGGSGGTIMFCIAGQTNWGTSGYSFGATGNYDFYVAVKCDPGYEGNATDPIQGRMAVNFSPYNVSAY
jgi:hypothetical protein